MCYKAMVLEVKDDYCIVMLDDSQIVRIKKKEGVREGQKIYVLEEDFYIKEKKQNGAVILPFAAGGKKKHFSRSFMTKAIAAAAAFLIFVGVATSPEIVSPVYATVSFDGNQSVQLDLDKENKVISAKSYDNTIDEAVLKAMKGKNLDELWDVLRKLSGEGESILVASAPRSKKAKNNEAILEQYIKDNLVNEKMICLRGDDDDVKCADEVKKSLGIYILEKAMSEKSLQNYLGDVPYAKGDISAFLDRMKDKYPQAYEQLMEMDEDFDAEDVADLMEEIKDDVRDQQSENEVSETDDSESEAAEDDSTEDKSDDTAADSQEVDSASDEKE